MQTFRDAAKGGSDCRGDLRLLVPGEDLNVICNDGGDGHRAVKHQFVDLVHQGKAHEQVGPVASRCNGLRRGARGRRDVAQHDDSWQSVASDEETQDVNGGKRTCGPCPKAYRA